MSHFDLQIVAQAKEFVNALNANKPAHMPVIRFNQWPLFISTVRSLSTNV